MRRQRNSRSLLEAVPGERGVRSEKAGELGGGCWVSSGSAMAEAKQSMAWRHSICEAQEEEAGGRLEQMTTVQGQADNNIAELGKG